MKLKTFTGFKGKIAFAQKGHIRFVLMAANERHLAAIWHHVMSGLPLDPAGIKPAILIEAATLPDHKAIGPISPISPIPDALDRLNATLESEIPHHEK